MLNSLKYSVLIFVILMQSCNAYKTFYSKTETSFQNSYPEKVLRLNVSNQNLKEVPEEISKFTHLKMLDLSGNTSVDLLETFNAIPNPKELEVLILDNLNLQELPENIKEFSNLKQLSINGNPLLNWSLTYSQLAVLPLRFLNLQYNNLSGLPQEISEIKTLKDLNLSNNKITEGSTFEHLSQLPKLYSLWLSYNSMKQLPPEIGLLNKVNNLYIGNNQLQSLPIEMKNMKQVWVIQAEHNAFTAIPEVFIEMPSLFSVHLNNCNIDTISEAFITENYTMKGLLLDNNNLNEDKKERWKKALNNFFLLSIE